MLLIRVLLAILLVSTSLYSHAEPEQSRKLADIFDFSEFHRKNSDFISFDACFIRQVIAHIKNPCTLAKYKVPYQSIRKACSKHLSNLYPRLGLADEDKKEFFERQYLRDSHIQFLENHVQTMRQKVCSKKDPETCEQAKSFLSLMTKSQDHRYHHHSDSWAFKQDLARVRSYLRYCAGEQPVPDEEQMPRSV